MFRNKRLNRQKLQKYRKKLFVFITIFAIFIPSLFVFLSIRNKASAGWYNEDWHYRKKFVIDHTKVAGTTDLTNFPILVSRTDTDLRDKAQTDGDDIVFTDVNGQKLDHEIEKYTSGTGELITWIRIPTLYSTVSTVIYMYYGNATCNNQQSITNVWNSNGSSNYTGVWHLDESPANGVAGHDNSANTNHDGTPYNFNGDANSSTNATGKIDGADHFDGTDDYVGIPDNDAFNIDPSQDYTFSAWSNADTAQQWGEIFGFGAGSDNYIEIYPTQSTSHPWLPGGSLTSGVSVWFSSSSSAYVVAASTNNATATGSNYLVTVTYDHTLAQNSRFKIYVNGVNVTNGTAYSAGTLATLYPTDERIGSIGVYSEYFDGYIDEARFSNKLFSADWIATEYANQNDPSGFFASVSSEDKGPSPALYYKFDDTPISNVIQDSSTNNNDGTISGALWKDSSMCITDNCFFFDGSDDVITATQNATINLDKNLSNQFMFSTWIKPNSDGENSIGQIFNKGNTTYARITNEGTDGKADLEVSLDLATTDATLNITDGITLNKWQLISIGYTDDADDEITVYINGEPKGSSTNGVGSPATDTNNLLIGGPTTANFHGYIDEFKIFTKEKTADEVKTDYLKGSSASGSSAVLGTNNSNSLSDGLLAYWKMDETTGNPIDASGNGYTTTWNGTGSHYGAGHFNRSAVFNGTDDYISSSITPSTFFGTGSTSFSISAWIYAATPVQNYQYPILVGAGANVGGCGGTGGILTANIEGLGIVDGIHFVLPLDPSGSCYEVSGVSDTHVGMNEWHLYTGTYNGQTKLITLYRDGKEVGQDSWAGTGSITWDSNFLMGITNSSPFPGRIDEVRIYNRTLSSQEADQLYNWATEPAGYWKLDENSGSNTYSSGSTILPGSLNGSAAWRTGRFGSAIYTGANTDFISINDNDVLDMRYALTVEAWIKRNGNTGAWNTILDKGVNNNMEYWFGFNTSNNLSLSLNPDNGDGGHADRYYNNSTSTITDSNWHHVAATYDGDNVYLYIDGKLDRTIDHNDLLYTGTGGIRIGYATSFSGVGFVGTTDEVKIYNYARSTKQIVEDMNAGHPAPGSPIGSPIGYWKLDEGYGDTAYNSSSAGSTLNGNLADTTACPQSGDSACPTWTNDAKYNKALSFDTSGTTDDYVSVPDNTALRPGNGSWTVSVWAKPQDANQLALLAGKVMAVAPNTNFSLGFAADTNYSAPHQRLVFTFTENASTIYRSAHSNADVIDGNWHMYTGVADKDNDRVYLYVDSYEITTAVHYESGAWPNITNTDPLYFGGYTGSTFNLNGSLDEIQIFNSALTPDQIKLLYNHSSSVYLGSTGTTTTGTVDNSATRAYCPPGNIESNCANGYNPAPVGEWKLDENTGTTTYDTSGGGLNGVLGDGTAAYQPTWTTGKFGPALLFDGSNDVVYSQDSDLYSFGNSTTDTPFTISAWVYATKSNYGEIARKPNEWDFNLSSSGYLVCSARDNSASAVRGRYWATAFPTNEWHHIECVYDGSRTTTGFSIYVDGIRKDDSDLTSGTYTAMENTTNVFRFGSDTSSSPSYPFGGKIDQLLIYNYVRSYAQIQWDYNHGAPIAWYKFDECQGATTYNASKNANDTPAGMNGTIYPGDATGNNDTTGSCSDGSSNPANSMWNAGTSGKNNASLSFDGTNDYIDAGNPTNLQLTATGSIATWIKWTSSSFESPAIVCKSNWTTDRNGFCLAGYNGGIDGELANATNQIRIHSTSTSYRDNQWHHAVFTWNGSYMNLYVDGASVATPVAQSLNPVSNVYNLTIAKDPNSSGYYFNGQIDDVRIYNYALTEQQIKLIYNNGAVSYK